MMRSFLELTWRNGPLGTWRLEVCLEAINFQVVLVFVTIDDYRHRSLCGKCSCWWVPCWRPELQESEKWKKWYAKLGSKGRCVDIRDISYDTVQDKELYLINKCLHISTYFIIFIIINNKYDHHWIIVRTKVFWISTNLDTLVWVNKGVK